MLTGELYIYLKKMSQTKLESLPVPNVDLNENPRKVLTEQDKFQHFFTSQLL